VGKAPVRREDLSAASGEETGMTGANGRAAGNVGEVVVPLPAGFLNATRVP
jgi:hypothetical protein